jgi:undecaprenyl-diphosphatase
MKHIFSSVMNWLGGHDLILFVGLTIVAGGSWAFVELADEVEEGETQAFDDRVLRALRRADDSARPIGPDWMAEIGRDVTALGGYAFLILLTTAVAVFLQLDRKLHAMWFLIAAVASGYAVTMGLKAVVSRPRPEVVPHLSAAFNTSFPSGHAMMSAVVFLTLGAILARMTVSLRLKYYFLASAVMLTLLVGASRVYMGVHYPTDVLAGWTGGLVWATLCSLVARQLQRRGKIETEL